MDTPVVPVFQLDFAAQTSQTPQTPTVEESSPRPAKKPPLFRNQACTSCKRKKRKCDAVRPVCGPCASSSNVYQRTPQCEYASSENNNIARPKKIKRTESPPSQDVVGTLERRIAELEEALTAAQLATATVTHGNALPPLSPPHSAPSTTGTTTHSPTNGFQGWGVPLPSAESAAEVKPTNLVHSGYPHDLPPLATVKTLVQAAMSLISSTLFVLPSDTLFHSLALAPTDPRFPSTALLHSLCAIGASMCPLPEEASSYWRSEASPSSYHFRQAKTHLQAFNIGTVLDNARAALLLCVYSFATEQFIEVWSLIGLACRSVAPAGLNHVQSECAMPTMTMGTSPGHFLRKPTFAGQPVDDYDVFYRTTTLWQIFACDVWMSACSGWSKAMALEDITAMLPLWPSDTTPLDVVINQSSLDPHSSRFFTEHLLSPILSLHLNFKSMILLSRVVAFLQHSTLPGAVANPEIKQQIRSSAAFLQLASLVPTYLSSFPGACRNPISAFASGRLDANLINAYIVPSVSLLLLYEPFILGSDEDDGFRRSLAAASSILRITEAIYSHSQDQIAYYNPQINFCWMVANRTLVRAMRFREDAGDGVGAEVYRGQVEFLLARITPLSSRSPLVSSCLQMLEGLIKDETPWHRG